MVFSQEAALSANVSDCGGAILMESNRIIKPKMPKQSGLLDDLNAYQEKLKFSETNSLWFKFESQHSGTLNLVLEKFDFPLAVGVFILNKGEDCAAIHNGKAALFSYQFMDAAENSLAVDTIQYLKSQIVFLFVNTTSQVNNQVAVQTTFKQAVNDEAYQSMKKTFDLRASASDQPFDVMIRDAKTNLPVVANVIVSESRNYNALYTASDIVFTYSDNLKMNLSVDASGYFFQDVKINSRKNTSKEQVVLLEPLEQDQLIELEGLVFESETDGLIPEALPKLKRLKDFMIINTEVNIEVQGHVHLQGRNTGKAKRLSKKRAKTVRNFLIEGGIDKKRIAVVGYGNSKMKYPEAETDAEKQANRRVEIKIK